MATFELVALKEDSELHGPPGQDKLGISVLLHNARWFTRVRWIVVGVFIIVGLAGILTPGFFEAGGLVLPSRWPWVLAAILIVANIPLSIIVTRLKDDSPNLAIESNIWIQISVDLLVVTLLVYIIGSTDTYIAFTYLFHIALACIFFPPKSSLLVTLASAALYLTLVSLEVKGVLPDAGILVNGRYQPAKDSSMVMIFAWTAVFVWLVVWYFVSTLSAAVRKRDQQLRDANERLIRADEEKNQQMLCTTHELKAPFAGIENNIQLLKYEYWDEIPESVRDVINRIDARAQTLRERIGKILILGDLKSQPTRQKQAEAVDLKKVMDAILDELSEKAKNRNIAISVDVPSAMVSGSPERLNILFSNLIANAISYSYEGGRVEVSAKQSAEKVVVSVSDYGIGIREDALPHIFEEYYRTKEASKFNKMSTGLGLSMVREIVRNLGLSIRVRSQVGEGTTFEVTIPKRNKKLN